MTNKNKTDMYHVTILRQIMDILGDGYTAIKNGSSFITHGNVYNIYVKNNTKSIFGINKTDTKLIATYYVDKNQFVCTKKNVCDTVHRLQLEAETLGPLEVILSYHPS